MMRLSDIFCDIQTKEWIGGGEQSITSLEYDSRRVSSGVCFFAVEGSVSDGHQFIGAAVASGAAAIVCERLPIELHPGVSYIVVEDSHRVLGLAAAQFYSHPSRELKLVGITGTNGKTTTATLLYDLFRGLGYRVGLISTVEYRIDSRRVESTHTTPDAVRLQSMMREMVDCGCDYCFMEVSSHSIVQQRIAALHFAGALFSNITHDHLDYHHTFAEYIKAKKGLFDSLSAEAFALSNIDDRNGRVMLQNCSASHYSYSLRSMADFRCRIVEMHIDSMLLRIGSDEIWVGTTGRFNAYNILAIYSVARLLGVEHNEVLVALSSLKAVCGRFEAISLGSGATAIIDYAHTPDALQSVINTVEEIISVEQQLIVVCGCGGDRDTTKRAAMGAIATSHAALTIFTSDNPRSESPEAIIEQMRSGVTQRSARHLSIVDRGEAIRTALTFAQRGDVVLIAGKGHEKYQIVGDQKLHFDDHEVVREFNENIKL